VIRCIYRDGPSFVVNASYRCSHDGFEVEFVSLGELIARLLAVAPSLPCA
jgi:hypothetical protein